MGAISCLHFRKDVVHPGVKKKASSYVLTCKLIKLVLGPYFLLHHLWQWSWSACRERTPLGNVVQERREEKVHLDSEELHIFSLPMVRNFSWEGNFIPLPGRLTNHFKIDPPGGIRPLKAPFAPSHFTQ